MNYESRKQAGGNAERAFFEWVHKQPGWHVEPYGQGLMTDKGRAMLMASSFNGDSKLVENFISEMTLDERQAYMPRVSAIPCLTRWMPDYVVAFQNLMIFCPDVKASTRPTPNYSIEMSSLLGAKVHSMTGAPCLYVFPPNDAVAYWSCATPDMIRKRSTKVMDGRNARGSGTPFYLVPKLALDIPVRRVMTEFELNGRVAIGELTL